GRGNSPSISGIFILPSAAWDSRRHIMNANVRRFEIRVDDSVLGDLGMRLADTRLPPDQGQAGWDAGSSPDYLRELLGHWQTKFDWRAEEENLNRFGHYMTEAIEILLFCAPVELRLP